MAKRKKYEPIDGFGPKERQRVASVVRQVWYQCRARKLAIKRATGKDGFTYCEKCKKRTPKICVDHIDPAGSVDGPYWILRMFVPHGELQCWCPKCHAAKTKAENKLRKECEDSIF